MRTKPGRSLACLFTLLFPAIGCADSAVWRVTHGDAVTYLAGTMHKLPPEQYPLPEAYGAAYERADTVVFETDIGAMQSPEIQSRLAEVSRLPQGRRLSTLLDDATYESLRAFCDSMDFPIQYLEPLKPAPAMLSLLAVTLQSLGITAPGVDEHFYRRARSDDKPVRGLEPVDAQIDFLMSLGMEDPDAFVSRSIRDLQDALSGALQAGVEAWRNGEPDGLVEHFIDDQMQYSPELYQSLLVDRNRAWMRDIRQYLETAETELVLVGVAHLVGDEGLIALLRDEGYTVERYSPS